jgi:hypothetical protein
MMKKTTRKGLTNRMNLTNRVNMVSNRIKSLYPHLYQSVGGKYVHRVLRDIYAPAKSR